MKVSIITACYNCEDTIKDAIDSVASQNYEDIEHIIIDGDSTDNTLNIIRQNSSKISKIISEPDKGIYDALNKGIENATGDIIAFLHADDLYSNDQIISIVAEKFKSSNSNSVYGDLLYVSKSNTNKVIRNWKAGSFSQKKLKHGWMPPHPTFFVKKTIYQEFGSFDISFKIAADYDIILRFLGKHKISCSYIPNIIIKMRVGGESNKSIKNIILKMQEDVKALKNNRLGNWHTVFLKNIIKIPQLFIK